MSNYTVFNASENIIYCCCIIYTIFVYIIINYVNFKCFKYLHLWWRLIGDTSWRVA